MFGWHFELEMVACIAQCFMMRYFRFLMSLVGTFELEMVALRCTMLEDERFWIFGWHFELEMAACVAQCLMTRYFSFLMFGWHFELEMAACIAQ